LKGEISKYLGLKFTLKDAGRTYRNIVETNKGVADPKVFCERNKFVIFSGAFTCTFTSVSFEAVLVK
jgi:hypothetical protein